MPSGSGCHPVVGGNLPPTKAADRSFVGPREEGNMTHAAAPSSIRAFVSIALSPFLLGEIEKWQRQIQSTLPGEGVRWTRREQLHLTLKFFGNVAADQVQELTAALQRAAEGIRPLRLSLAGLGCFPTGQRPNVIWVGVAGELAELETLQRRIDDETGAYGSHSEDREFRPHLTVGRVKASPSQARAIGEVVRQTRVGCLGDWLVAEVELIQSTLRPQGSIYTRLVTLPLRA
jgi:2'-5' RNA ligase